MSFCLDQCKLYSILNFTGPKGRFLTRRFFWEICVCHNKPTVAVMSANQLMKETSLYLQDMWVWLQDYRKGSKCLNMHSSFSLFQLYSSREWCQVLMGVWVWLRSVNVWSTLFLSAFHLQTLRRVAPSIGNLNGPRGAPKTLLLSLGLIWLLNFIYSIPAHIFSTNGNENSTEVRAHCSKRLP